MKKAILISAIILLIFVAAGIYFFTATKKASNANGDSAGVLPGAGTVLPGSNGQALGFAIKGADGKSLSVRNFLVLPDVKEDPDNTGYYNLGYQPGDNILYLISYISETTFFNIALLKEPIGQSRAQVETYLVQTLGISKDQLCSLNYSISVPNSVNSNYSGMNLGFSSCPGAVKLP